jgi:hypothetical protein
VFARRPTQSLDRYSVVGLPLMRLVTQISFYSEEKNNARTVSDSFLWASYFDLCVNAPGRPGSGQNWEKLPFGAAMPLGEFQENLRLGEGLPIAQNGKQRACLAAAPSRAADICSKQNLRRDEKM